MDEMSACPRVFMGLEAIERLYEACSEGANAPTLVQCLKCGCMVPDEPACEHLLSMVEEMGRTA